MKPIYARKNTDWGVRRVMLDMAYLSTAKKIRFPKYLYEDGLFIPFKPDAENDKSDKFFLSKENIISEDSNFYYFKFPFKAVQVEDVAV